MLDAVNLLLGLRHNAIIVVCLHTPTTVTGLGFPTAFMSFFHTIFQIPLQLGSPNLTYNVAR